MRILIKNSQRKTKVRLKKLEALARKALKALGLNDAELSILLINDALMQELNRLYRNKDKSTDVLAFSMREGKGSDINPNLLGDIVISLPTAKRQAKEKGHSLYDEIAVLLVHGMLHLIGYDHEKGKREKTYMRKMEKKILGAVAYLL